MWYLLVPFVTFAGGFQINTQGQKAIGMGGSITGLAIDGSVVFFNPAGMSFLDSNYVNAGFSLIIPQTTFLGGYGSSEKMSSQLYTPYYVYGAFKLKGKLSAGISINNPFGLGTKWDDNWSGRYISQQARLTALFIQPSLSYKINNHLSFGGGPAIVLGAAKFRKAIPYANSDGTEAGTELKGNTTGLGFNAGVFVSYGKITFGLDYRSKVKLDLKNGDATFTNVPPSLISINTIPTSTKFNSSINLPSVFSLGIGYKVTDKLLINLDLNFTGWSVYDSLNFEFPEYPALNNSNARKYKSSYAARIGAQYKSTDKLTIRLGIAYDQTPVKDGYVSPELPDANKFVLAGGLTYRVKRHLYLEGSVMMENVSERKEISNVNTNFNGTYKSYLYIFGLGLQYNF